MTQTERLNRDAVDREYQMRIDHYREVEKVLRETGKRAFRAMNNVAAFFSTREKVSEFAAQGFAVKDLAGLKRLEEAITAIPLLQVSDDHVETVLNLGGYLTEFIHHVETAVENHRNMDEEGYRKFFNAMRMYLSGIRDECESKLGIDMDAYSKDPGLVRTKA